LATDFANTQAHRHCYPRTVPYRLPKPLVLLLAGLPASGKTTLLHEALRDGRALFGEDVRDAFMRTNPPPPETEHLLTLEQRMQIGSWVNEGDLVRLHLRRERPMLLVVHFDLLWFLRIGYSLRAGHHTYETLEGFADFLGDGEQVTGAFRETFGLHPVQGSRTLIRVEKPAYAIVCARSRRREGTTGRADLEQWNQFLNRHLYNGRPDGERLYERLYADWQQAVADPAGPRPEASLQAR
jgi:hypothetical protein